MRSRTLRDHHGYRATLHRADFEADVLLVTFGSVRSDLEPEGFGTSLAMRMGFDNIYVSQRASSQYQDLSREEFGDIVGPIAHRYTRVITYGASLGGYCAVYYGGIIDAEIVAVSPINSAHPMIRRRSFSRLPYAHEPIASGAVSSHVPFIIYDPKMRDDQAFIDETIAPAYPGARYIRFPYAGHKVLVTLEHSWVITDFIDPLLRRREVVEVPVRQQDSHIWHTEKGRELVHQQRWSAAQEHLSASIELKPTKDAAKLLCRVYYAQNRHRELQHLEQHLIEVLPRRPAWLPFRAAWLTGRPETVVSAGNWTPGSPAINRREVKPGMAKSIAQQPGYRIRVRRASVPSPHALIAFGGSAGTPGRVQFAGTVAKRLGCDLFTVTPGAGTYYQHLSLASFRAAVGPYLEDYEQVLAFGAGLGGYAALYFGADIDAQIVAASPRNAAHPASTRTPGSLPQFVHRDLSDSPSLSRPPVVLLDPTRTPESRFLTEMVTPRYPQTQVVELPGAGPNAFLPMAEQGRLSSFLRTVLDEGHAPDIEVS